MPNLTDNPLLISFISLGIGGLLGLASSLLISSVRQRQAITLRMLDKFFEMRKEAASLISQLTTLSLDKALSDQQRVRFRDRLSRLTYEHFDFLPRPVLESLLLLYVALGDKKGRIYRLEGGTVVPITTNKGIAEFVEKTSLFKNAKLIAPLALTSRNQTARCNQAISLHARNVLLTVNKYASTKHLLAMTKRLRKAAG